MPDRTIVYYIDVMDSLEERYVIDIYVPKGVNLATLYREYFNTLNIYYMSTGNEDYKKYYHTFKSGLPDELRHPNV